MQRKRANDLLSKEKLIVMKTLMLVLLTGFFAFNLQAQKVRRKGVPPIDVSKNKQPGAPKEAQFSLKQLAGKWFETSRYSKADKSTVEYTDTIYLNFEKQNKVITRQGNSANMTGEAAIEPGNVLVAAADIYTIVSANDSILVLDNQDDLVHTLQKTKTFSFENYGKLSIKPEEFSIPVPVTLPEVKGNWMVYRKVAKPGAINPPVNIIQYLKITDSTGENTANGEVTFYQTEKSTLLPCTIKVNNASIDIVAGEFRWSLFVYKADSKELVFGDAAELLYYAKKY